MMSCVTPTLLCGDVHRGREGLLGDVVHLAVISWHAVVTPSPSARTPKCNAFVQLRIARKA
jgi:hypothetical protein